MLKVVGASWLQTKISSYILGLLGILAIIALFVGQIERKDDGNYSATVFYSEKTGYRIEYWGQSNDLADISKGVARAYFRVDIEENGWSMLEVETDGSYPDNVQAYAAGIVEGALTWYLIHTHLENTVRSICDGREKQCDKVRDTLDRSADVWKSYSATKAEEIPLWHHVSLYYTQVNGIFTGWKHGVERSATEYDTDISDLYWLNAMADVKEIQHKLNVSLYDGALDNMPGISSAFMRFVENNHSTNKLFVAHNTAGSYSSMTRIMKRYKLNYHQTAAKGSPPAPGTSVDFSGYPGSITSQDEFYVVRGSEYRLAVTGTTINNYNNNIWKDVNVTVHVPIGPRVYAANHLASNVSSWGHVLASSNSGTACKQWLVSDFSYLKHLRNIGNASPKIINSSLDIVTEVEGIHNEVKHVLVHRNTSGSHLKGLIWLIEQVPGRTHSADITDLLVHNGYWNTNGVPYFKDIASITHNNKMEELYGNVFSESDSPRANAFKMGYQNATSLDAIIALMRQTNLSKMTNESAKCADGEADELTCLFNDGSVLGARGDIAGKLKEAFGVIDTKIVTAIENGTTDLTAISGPPFTKRPEKRSRTTNKGNLMQTYNILSNSISESNINTLEVRDLVKDRQQNTIKPFQWSNSAFEIESHEGLPDKWEFGPFKPKWSW